MERWNDENNKIDYLSICSPNHLHDAHISLALRLGANAICEKPLVLNPWNLDALQELENEFGSKVYTILQLRVHPTLLELKRKLDIQHQVSSIKLARRSSGGNQASSCSFLHHFPRSLVQIFIEWRSPKRRRNCN